MKNLDDKTQPQNELNFLKGSHIPESDKKYIIITICVLVFFDYTGYGLPVTLYPQIALAHGLDSTLTGVVLGLFPLGGFFISCLTGKVMRFYRKDKLLIFFLVGTCISKFVFGCVYFIDDENWFLVVSILSRLTLGFCFTAFQTICISLIPEAWPNQIVEMLSYYTLFLNCGLIAGPILGSLIAYFLNFFWVFTIFTAIHFVIGMFGILKFLKIEGISQFLEKRKSLEFSKILGDSTVMILFLFQTLFFGSILFISSGFENYIIYDLGGTQSLCAGIYCLNMIGFCISLFAVNKIKNANAKKKILFLLGSLGIIVFNNLFGPNPLFGIKDTQDELICVALGFFMVGVCHGLMAVLLVPEYKDILRVIFPNDAEELIVDMAPALYLSAYSLAEFANAIVGGIIIDEIGYVWASVIYSVVLCFYFVIYWGKQWDLERNYAKMVEEEEVGI